MAAIFIAELEVFCCCRFVLSVLFLVIMGESAAWMPFVIPVFLCHSKWLWSVSCQLPQCWNGAGFMKCCCLHQTFSVCPIKVTVTQRCSQKTAWCPWLSWVILKLQIMQSFEDESAIQDMLTCNQRSLYYYDIIQNKPVLPCKGCVVYIMSRSVKYSEESKLWCGHKPEP